MRERRKIKQAPKVSPLVAGLFTFGVSAVLLSITLLSFYSLYEWLGRLAAERDWVTFGVLCFMALGVVAILVGGVITMGKKR